MKSKTEDFKEVRSKENPVKIWQNPDTAEIAVIILKFGQL